MSTTGTFIKLLNSVEVKEGTILEMGSNQFYIKVEDGMPMLEVLEGPAQGVVAHLKPEGKISIGRKTTNDISFGEDQHLSNLHAYIHCVADKFYV